jgi:hypothetical protein
MPASVDSALEAMKTVQALDGRSLEARIQADIGTPMMAVFTSLARSMFPEDDDEVVARKVHLMVLAYLLKGEVGS